MATQLVIRWSGLVLLVGGILGVTSTLLAPSSNASSVALEPSWVVVQTIAVLANLLVSFGIIGLCLDQDGKLDRLNLAVFMLAFFATGLAVAVSAIQAYVYPAIAALPNAPPLLSQFTSPNGPLPLVGKLYLAFLILYEPGYILMSINLVRTGVPSRAAGWLLLIGSVMSNAIFLGAPLIGKLGLLAFGLALAWLGYALWSGQTTKATTPGQVTA